MGTLSKHSVDFVRIASSQAWIGSTREQLEDCVRHWGPLLIDPAYEPRFRDWIAKEVPAHQVRLHSYRIGRFPVTNAEYKRFAEATDQEIPESLAKDVPPDHPVWGVSYEAATAYAEWIGEQIGSPCRLPTEVEWEFAARGPERREFPFGDSFDPRRCNTIEAGIGTTTAVDRYADGVSTFGVYDLAGNVEEWTSSYYAPYPGGRWIDDDISRDVGRSYRVLRGGSFALGGDLARSARRHGPHPGELFRFRGFRVVTA